MPALLSLNDLLQTLHLLFFALTGRQMDISAFLHENDISPSALPRIEPEELTRLQLSAAADERSHHTYLEEQALWDKVRQGLSYQEIFQDDPRFHSGQVAKNSFKQDEYLCVATITLLTRAGHRGGPSSRQRLRTQRPLPAEAGKMRRPDRHTEPVGKRLANLSLGHPRLPPGVGRPQLYQRLQKLYCLPPHPPDPGGGAGQNRRSQPQLSVKKNSGNMRA